MKTIIFYALICSSQEGQPGILKECSEFQPMAWTVSTQVEEEKALAECSILANTYSQLYSVRDVDCYTK